MPYATVEDVAAVLRLKAGDVDEARIADALEVTARAIDKHLAPRAGVPVVDPRGGLRVIARPAAPRIVDPSVDAVLRQANMRAAIDWYEAQRAPGGYVDTGDPLGTPGRLSIDPLAGVLGLLDTLDPPGGFA